MNKLYKIFLYAGIFLQSNLFAQYAITGKVTTWDGAVAEFANVLVVNIADTSQFVGTVADINGKFEFSGIRFQQVYIKASLIGYASARSEAILLPHHEFVNLILIPVATDIEEISIVAFKPKIEIEAGKTTLNVDNSTISTGLNAMELIRRIPGVFVDNDGNISIKGKSGVNIYIDDKPTYMSGRELKNLLNSLQASNIEKIEVMNQPGAAYDAQGNAGILNIKLKKKMNLGFNGTLDAFYGQGIYPKAGGSFTFNYGKGKWNFNGSYAYNYRKGLMETSMERAIGNASYARRYTGVSQDHSHMAKLGFDYDINKKRSIGSYGNFTGTHNDWKGGGRAIFSDALNTVVDSVNITEDYTPWSSYNIQLNINSQWKIDTNGQKLMLNVDGGTFRENTRGDYRFFYLLGNGDTARTVPNVWYTQTPQLYLVSGKLDYIHPNLLGFQVEAGLKSSYVSNDGPVEFKTRDSLNNEVVITNQTNHFLYLENINAIYISIKRNFKKWNFHAGLRGEHSNITGKQIITSQLNKQQYFSLFPTAGISYIPNENHNLSLLYSRRIDRPSYGELNPFVYVLDNFSSYQGNPNLKPEFSENFELNYTLFQALSFNTTYSLITDASSEIFFVDSLNPERLIFSSGNIGRVHNFSSGVTLSMSVGNWLFMMVSGNAIYNNFKDTLLNIANEGWYGMFSGYIEFYLPMKFTMELNGYVMTSMPDGQQLSKPMGEVSAGISKSLLKDQMKIKFNVSDIFRTTQWRAFGISPSGESFYSTYWWDSRVFTFSISYKLGAGNREFTTKKDSLFDRVGGGRN
ncbi:MAG: TonB-dependent receptor [Flavobacteriales bacterium]|nr:TonB-dependent receptor [Flavobacteriales bacterium]